MTIPETCKREIDRVEDRMEAYMTDATKDRRALHSRVTRLEIRVAYYAGGAAALGGLIGALIGIGIV